MLASYMLPGLEQEASQNVALWSRVNRLCYGYIGQQGGEGEGLGNVLVCSPTGVILPQKQTHLTAILMSSGVTGHTYTARLKNIGGQE